jgi:hypothetical protein
MIKDFIIKNIKNQYDITYLKKRSPNEHRIIFELTNFLPEQSKISERLYCIKNDIITPILCEECNINPVKYNIPRKRYLVFCSKECASKSKNVKDKRKSTMTLRYGADNPAKIDEFVDKRKSTMTLRYGSEHALQSSELRKKFVETCIKNHGVMYPQQSSEVRKKTIKNNIKKYGKANPTQKHISNEIFEILDNKNWLINEHHTKNLPLYRIAEKLDISSSLIESYFKKHNIEIKQQNSYAEIEIISFIKENCQGTILENNRTIIKPFELDIVLPELKIAIEYCGLYWHSNVYKDKKYHTNKLKMCNEVGYRLITIFEDEWIYKQDIVKNKLLMVIGESKLPRIYARMCKVEKISSKDKNEFLERYHIQGKDFSSIKLGLKLSDKLVAVMTFRKLKDGSYDLNRFASSASVIGGFSKLLTHFKRNYEWNEISTFADLRWSEGNLYLLNGFFHLYNTTPNYFYIKQQNRLSRHGFMKHKLPSKLKHFDGSLTEQDNMIVNGFKFIYDCGHMKFVMKK